MLGETKIKLKLNKSDPKVSMHILSSMIMLTFSNVACVFQVIAFHFCQSDNNTTCYVPEFLHNIASQLSLAPQLAAYSEMLAADAELQKLLTFRNCIINPSLTLEKAIIEPLVELRKSTFL